MLPDLTLARALTLRQRRGTLGAANDRDAMRVRRYDGAPAARRGGHGAGGVGVNLAAGFQIPAGSSTNSSCRAPCLIRTMTSTRV